MNDLALLLSVVSVNTCLKGCVRFDFIHIKYLELLVRKGVIFKAVIKFFWAFKKCQNTSCTVIGDCIGFLWPLYLIATNVPA